MNHLNYQRQIARFLLCSDILGLIICFNLAHIIRLGTPIDIESILPYTIMAVCLLSLYLADTYRPDVEIAGLWTPARALVCIFTTFTGIGAIAYMAGTSEGKILVGRGILSIGLGLFCLWAVISRQMAAKWGNSKKEDSRWLVLARGEKSEQIGTLYRKWNPKATLVFLADFSGNGKSQHHAVAVMDDVDTIDNFDSWCDRDWSGVLIDESIEPLAEPMVRKLMDMRLRGIYVYSLAGFYEKVWEKIPPHSIKDDWFAFTSGFALLHNRINLKIKRTIDLLGSAILLILSLPLTILAAIAIKLDSPGALFYSQVRTGLDGKSFKVYKFRSMYRDAESRGAQWAMTSDPRITNVGRIIRATRIDELPQLLNVFKGEMSLIGPRPERPEFDAQLRREIPYYDVRYLVKPGITGWAQVMYPYGASVEDAYQKVAYDLYYIKNYSLLLDVAIVLKTIRIVILGKGR
jgi:exopolysaccharide biosynthesis polyprenyl glycosylphosphotransferase